MGAGLLYCHHGFQEVGWYHFKLSAVRFIVFHFLLPGSRYCTTFLEFL